MIGRPIVRKDTCQPKSVVTLCLPSAQVPSPFAVLHIEASRRLQSSSGSGASELSDVPFINLINGIQWHGKRNAQLLMIETPHVNSPWLVSVEIPEVLFVVFAAILA